MTTFVHQERALAESLGLAQKDLRSVRTDELTRGTDWQTVRGEVCYSQTGHARLLALLKVSTSATAPEAHSAPKNSAEPTPPPAETPPDPAPADAAVRPLECVRTFPLNRRIVQARCDGQLVRVRVRDSANFTTGMTMLCRLIDGDLWELAQRLPRWRGKS